MLRHCPPCFGTAAQTQDRRVAAADQMALTARNCIMPRRRAELPPHPSHPSLPLCPPYRSPRVGPSSVSVHSGHFISLFSPIFVSPLAAGLQGLGEGALAGNAQDGDEIVQMPKPILSAWSSRLCQNPPAPLDCSTCLMPARNFLMGGKQRRRTASPGDKGDPASRQEEGGKTEQNRPSHPPPPAENEYAADEGGPPWTDGGQSRPTRSVGRPVQAPSRQGKQTRGSQQSPPKGCFPVGSKRACPCPVHGTRRGGGQPHEGIPRLCHSRKR